MVTLLAVFLLTFGALAFGLPEVPIIHVRPIPEHDALPEGQMRLLYFDMAHEAFGANIRLREMFRPDPSGHVHFNEVASLMREIENTQHGLEDEMHKDHPDLAVMEALLKRRNRAIDDFMQKQDAKVELHKPHRHGESDRDAEKEEGHYWAVRYLPDAAVTLPGTGHGTHTTGGDHAVDAQAHALAEARVAPAIRKADYDTEVNDHMRVVAEKLGDQVAGELQQRLRSKLEAQDTATMILLRNLRYGILDHLPNNPAAKRIVQQVVESMAEHGAEDIHYAALEGYMRDGRVLEGLGRIVAAEKKMRDLLKDIPEPRRTEILKDKIGKFLMADLDYLHDYLDGMGRYQVPRNEHESDFAYARRKHLELQRRWAEFMKDGEGNLPQEIKDHLKQNLELCETLRRCLFFTYECKK